MEIKKVKLGNDEVEIFIENDPGAYDTLDLVEELDDTQDLNLEEIKKQYDLENTITIKEENENG